MPARAIPIGRPMASTDPKARIKTMMAKAIPSSSELGTSNVAKICPPIAIWRPSIFRHHLLEGGADRRGFLESDIA